jgi:myo-inositol 2-dehydrogenase/D-chiro-inositol 1-dehydrogenase
MPVESGPTTLLPFSQRFEGGYLAFNRPEFVDFFAEHHVQVPLTKGDAVFFNPALYHGAGSNVSADIRRIVNLLQISSPFGRAMEALDRTAMVRAVYPALRAMKAAGSSQRELLNAVVATAEGYAFPTNLDSDQPIGSLAPPSQGRHRAGRVGRRPHRRTTRRRAARPRRSEKAMTTLGVIGLGRIGAFHTDTLSGLDGVDGLVVADERPEVVAAVAAKHGAKPADSVEELLASGVDGVVVSAATPAHAELTLAAVHRGLPTFCEKPIAATAAESAKVAEVIARSGVPVQVGYQRRFDAAFAAAKRAVDDGSLGMLHTVRSTTMDPAPPPMEYIAGSGGIFRDCAVHDFDVLRWITGQQAVEVYATGSVQGDPRFTEYGDVDTAAVVVTFDQGTIGLVSAARYNGRGYDCRLEVHGFHDTVVAGWDQGAPVRNVDPDNEFPAGPAHHFFMDRFTDAFRAELSAFVDVVNGTAAPACTVADAVEVAWLAEAATESLQRGVPVRIEDVRSQ